MTTSPLKKHQFEDSDFVFHLKNHGPSVNKRDEPLKSIEDPVDLMDIRFESSIIEQINASAWILVHRDVYVDIIDEKNGWPVPEQFFQCLNVRELILDRNHLEILPIDVGRLINLTHLDLSYNELAVLPEEVGELCCLSRLEVNNNKLNKIPSSLLINCRELRYLSLNDNRIGGAHIIDEDEINEEDTIICNWNKLQVLNLGINNLVAFPIEICSCTSLEVLNLSYNYINQPIPRQASNLKHLNTLFLNGNKLNENLVPSQCLWTGTNDEPLEFCNLQLGENKFHYVPTVVWHLSSLVSLGLDKNPLHMFSPPPTETQIVPTNLLTNLETLDLFGTSISELPNLITNMTSLTHIDLRSCYKMGHFPMTLVNRRPSPLKNLIRLDFSHSAIDAIPPEISELKSLRSLICDNCKNLKCIPKQELVSLPELKILSFLDCSQLLDPPPEVIQYGFATLMGYMNGSLQVDDVKSKRFDVKSELPVESTHDDPTIVVTQSVTSAISFIPTIVTAWTKGLINDIPSLTTNIEPKAAEKQTEESFTGRILSFWK